MDDGGRDDRSFEQRLAAAREAAGAGQARQQAAPGAGAAARAVNLAMRLGVELVASMLIAVLLGWGLDRLFHTRPWLMVAMVPVGMAAGLRNLIRATKPGR